MAKKKKGALKRFWDSTIDWWTRRKRIDVSEPFERVELSELRAGDLLLFYYGNKLTQAHGEWLRSTEYGHAKPAPFHAAIVFDRCEITKEWIILDPEVRTTLSPISEYLKKSSYRIDIVRFKATAKQRAAIQQEILKIARKEGYYDVKGYGAFASQVMPLRWVKNLVKPSKKLFFCSDASTYCVHKATKIRVSKVDGNFTAPVDLLIYGMKNHTLYTIKERGEVL